MGSDYKTQIAYLLPAVPGETVRITTRLIYMDDTRIVIEGVMTDGNAKRMKAIVVGGIRLRQHDDGQTDEAR